jgi:hypothetical protein
MTHTMIPRTNYLMEQESSLMQAQAGSDGGWYCWQDKSGWEEEWWALQGHAQVAPALGTPCLGPCGPRDMIS